MRLPRLSTNLRTTATLNYQIQVRQYTPTLTQRYPTAIARAERAADLKKHPEAALTQEKLADVKGNRHWTEENATLSEADVSFNLFALDGIPSRLLEPGYSQYEKHAEDVGKKPSS